MTHSSPVRQSAALRGAALATTPITLLVVLVGTLMIQPKLTQRLNIDDRDVLTADEVADLLTEHWLLCSIAGPQGPSIFVFGC